MPSVRQTVPFTDEETSTGRISWKIREPPRWLKVDSEWAPCVHTRCFNSRMTLYEKETADFFLQQNVTPYIIKITYWDRMENKQHPHGTWWKKQKCSNVFATSNTEKEASYKQNYHRGGFFENGGGVEKHVTWNWPALPFLSTGFRSTQYRHRVAKQFSKTLSSCKT